MFRCHYIDEAHISIRLKLGLTEKKLKDKNTYRN